MLAPVTLAAILTPHQRISVASAATTFGASIGGHAAVRVGDAMGPIMHLRVPIDVMERDGVLVRDNPSGYPRAPEPFGIGPHGVRHPALAHGTGQQPAQVGPVVLIWAQVPQR